MSHSGDGGSGHSRLREQRGDRFVLVAAHPRLVPFGLSRRGCVFGGGPFVYQGHVILVGADAERRKTRDPVQLTDAGDAAIAYGVLSGHEPSLGVKWMRSGDAVPATLSPERVCE
jgi:hypothetical protein